MCNSFRKWNKSMLVNVFMSKKHKDIYSDWLVSLDYYKINRNLYEWTPLMNCCIRNKISIARLLLIHSDIDVNVQNNSGRTALYYSKKHNRTKLINLLESYGAK